MDNHHILKLPSQLSKAYFCIFIKNESINFINNYISKLDNILLSKNTSSSEYSIRIIELNNSIDEIKLPLKYIRNIELLLKEEMHKNEENYLFKV